MLPCELDGQSDAQPHLRSWLALFAVWIFWGTTYLGIRVALESFPPALLLGLRFTISGSVLLAASPLLKMKIPGGAEARRTIFCGFLTLGIGTGCLCLAEQWVPSGLAALFITTSPFWMLGVDAIIPGGDRFHKPVLWGMLIGLCGTLLLVMPIGSAAGLDLRSGKLTLGFVVLQFGNIAWCIGSIMQRRAPNTVHPIMSGAVQQIATGLVFLIPSLFIYGPTAHWDLKGALAILYLATFGSIIGYSAYLYSLDTLPVAIVTTYNYVNPVVAVILGWLFYREPLGWREMAAMTIIFLGVAIVRHVQSAHR
ncbi:MAG TPA: EamA family transporter [Bryobacteraceae bacterium]|jgi:drug/metabolite transporter (DMT)-like permease